MVLSPIGNRVVVRPLEAPDKSQGGIIIPDSAKEKPRRGRVLAAGAGKYADNGRLIPMSVKAGDDVFYSRYAGSEVKWDNEELLLINEDEVLAVVQK